MNTPDNQRAVRTAIEIFVNLLLIGIILVWCYRIIEPFVSIVTWAAVIAVSMYKPFLKLKALVGGRSKLALALFTLLGLAIIIVPAWLFVGSIVDSAVGMTTALETGEVHVPPPNESVREWPLVGEKLYGSWSEAASNLGAFVADHSETLKTIISGVLSTAAGIGIGALQFAIATLIAAAFLANAEKIVGGLRILFTRIVGDNADDFLKLSSATVTSVAVGVLGISAIQSFLAGIGMMAVGVPAAGILALIVLILCIAQLPPWLVMFPVIAYVFSVESTTVASVFAIWGVVVSFLDMVLKPMFLGRGVEAPMLVILLGAIGGMLMSGIIGLFVGAVVLALGYKLFEAWLVMNDDGEPVSSSETT